MRLKTHWECCLLDPFPFWHTNRTIFMKIKLMKNLMLLMLAGVFCLFSIEVSAQDDQYPADQLNLPGDNLNLYAVMKLFQESPTLEEFEKKLNDQSNKVNNLDLNGDNQIDYIKVIDNADGETHNIALKVAVSETEDQDVAVFNVHKDKNGQVEIQLIGDEDLYGKDYIIEPDGAAPASTPNPGYSGNEPPPVIDNTGYQVSAWPVVQFIYVPTYTIWRSPWHWGYYPSYWHPWTPFFWHEYYGYQYHWNYYYRAHYRYTPVYRYPAWREHYYGGGFRSRSNVVEVRVRAGNYRQTYARPELANRGSDLFRRDHPKAPSVNRPLPQFDRNNNNRPVVNRMNRPVGAGARPGNDNADTRPGITRPGRPGAGNENSNGNNNGNNRPGGIRPVNPNPSNGNNPPGGGGSRPVITRPASPNPNPSNSNNNDNSSSRPNRTRPFNPNSNPNPGSNRPAQPVSRPANPNASNGNNVPSRPAPRPNVSQPSNPRPANGNNFPNRPVARPAAPPQQQRPTPRPNPGGGGGQPPREHHGNR